MMNTTFFILFRLHDCMYKVEIERVGKMLGAVSLEQMINKLEIPLQTIFGYQGQYT